MHSVELGMVDLLLAAINLFTAWKMLSSLPRGALFCAAVGGGILVMGVMRLAPS